MTPTKRMSRKGYVISLAVLITSALSGCATQNTHAETRGETITGQICSETIRVQRGQEEFDACTASLAASGPRNFDSSIAWTQITPPSLRTDNGSPGSYFETSDSEHRVREELACRQLKLTNGTEVFFRCVSNLDKALFIARHPGA